MLVGRMERPLHAWPASRRTQRGAATLVVVMILFFIMAMMAAYANRSLVFEQRIASNYFRSGLSVEVADAGLEWAVAQLNGGNIDSTCQSAPAAASSFRQRYLNIDTTTRSMTPTLASGGYDTPVASCVRDASTGLWNCSCPDPVAKATTPAVAAANQIQPSFQVGINGGGNVVTLQAIGCTGSTSSACLTGNAGIAAQQLLASSQATVQVALVSALKSTVPRPSCTVSDGLVANRPPGLVTLNSVSPAAMGVTCTVMAPALRNVTVPSVTTPAVVVVTVAPDRKPAP